MTVLEDEMTLVDEDASEPSTIEKLLCVTEKARPIDEIGANEHERRRIHLPRPLFNAVDPGLLRLVDEIVDQRPERDYDDCHAGIDETCGCGKQKTFATTRRNDDDERRPSTLDDRR